MSSPLGDDRRQDQRGAGQRADESVPEQNHFGRARDGERAEAQSGAQHRDARDEKDDGNQAALAVIQRCPDHERKHRLSQRKGHPAGRKPRV